MAFKYLRHRGVASLDGRSRMGHIVSALLGGLQMLPGLLLLLLNRKPQFEFMHNQSLSLCARRSLTIVITSCELLLSSRSGGDMRKYLLANSLGICLISRQETV